MILHLWNLKYDTNESMKQKQNQRHREQTGGYQAGRRWERVGLGVEDQQMQTVYIEWDKQYSPTVQHRELYSISSVQSLSHVQLFATPWTAAHQASLSITSSWSLLKLMSIESVMPSNHLILCHPLHLPPLIFPSIRVFSNESVLCIRWPKDWSFSFSISPSNKYSGLISFRMDWLDLLAVQGTLKSLLQHHSSKASILQCSASSQSNSYIYT